MTNQSIMDHQLFIARIWGNLTEAIQIQATSIKKSKQKMMINFMTMKETLPLIGALLMTLNMCNKINLLWAKKLSKHLLLKIVQIKRGSLLEEIKEDRQFKNLRMISI